MQRNHCCYAAPRQLNWTRSKVFAGAARLLGGAVIALATTYLPSAGRTFSGAALSQTAPVNSRVVNRLKNGDRRTLIPAGVERIDGAKAEAETGAESGAASFNERFAIEPARAKSQLAPSADQRIPLGCDPAFSRIQSARNFAARCVTSIERPVKLALVETR